MRIRPLQQEASSGNVFADLGLPDPDEHLLKAGLVLKISHVINERGLTQSAAARLLGMDPPGIHAHVEWSVPQLFG